MTSSQIVSSNVRAASKEDARASGLRALAGVTVVWFACAVVVSVSGVMAWLPPPMIPLFVLGSNVALWAWYRRSGALRTFADGVSLRAFAALHVPRAAFGAQFLAMVGEGRMPASVGLHAGYGDIVAGVLALAVAVVPVRETTHRKALFAWNVIAFVDIVTVVAAFQRALLIERHPGLMATFPHWPYPMLPFFIVPWVVATHLYVFKRLRSGTV